jgi:hypothetical protein
VLSSGPEVEVAGSARGGKTRELFDGRVGRVAQHAARRIQHLVDILRGQDQFCGVHDNIVIGIFGILYRAEERVGAAAQHDVEGAPAAVHLVSDGDGREERCAEQLGHENSADHLTAKRMRLDCGAHSCCSGASRR